MSEQFLMGNEAIALGALHAGVNVVCGYPGTPSTEILETTAKLNDGSVYVEWSVNEKAALEVAAGAAYSGARVMVTMKQVGLNVASDPLMSLAYVGVKGGMVIVSADDPGPISSQTEQDTRTFARFSKLPVFDPSSPQEAYEMIGDAFELSEKYGTPVLFRPTTRVCHGCASITVSDSKKENVPEGFVKDSSRWVIFPRLSYNNHIKIEKRNAELSDILSSYRFNTITGSGRTGIATSGISYEYVMEAINGFEDKFTVLKVATANPFPEKLAEDFISRVDEVIAIEELDPVIERELTYICGKKNINKPIKGKLTGDNIPAGENSVESVIKVLSSYTGAGECGENRPEPPVLPIRPPVLCAGCPHRASFYAVKQAMKGTDAVFCGDIGCYTLGNAMPLDMVDTCLCMGADITVAQGIRRTNSKSKCFSFIGDSTFFASGMTGIANAIYNNTDITVIVLDNSTTAMTGHQPHPGTGKTMMNTISEKISIEKVIEAMGASCVRIVNPLDLESAISAVKEVSAMDGVKAIIFRSPCIAVSKPSGSFIVDGKKCVNCKKCIRELGCPAVTVNDGAVTIEKSLCFGCGLCAQVCPCGAIVKE